MGTGVCLSVWVLVFVSVWWTDATLAPSGYSDVNSSRVHESWNRLVSFLLGKDAGDDPWRDLPEVISDHKGPGSSDVSVDSLKNLSDEEIWSKISGNSDWNQKVEEIPVQDRMLNDEFIDTEESQNSLDDDSLLKTATPEIKHSNISSNNSSSKTMDKREVDASVLTRLLSQEEYQSDSASAGPQDVNGSTLAFVFDTTGSMWDDLVQVRHGAAKIMETMLQRPDRPISNYVLVPFHDPLIGPVTETTDHKLLMERLNEIQIYGGGDCPEASVGAVQQALQRSKPNSYIYVFTDARSKDYYLLSQILPLIQRKQSQVVFVMTGDCGDQNHPGYQVYHKIAATSSGQVYHLNKTDVDEVLSFVRVSLQSRKVNLLSVERPAAKSGSELPLPIDETLKEFTVSVSGSNASIGVVDPGGHTVQAPQLTPLLDLQHVKVVNVKEPPPGVWTLQVGSDSQHTVRSTGLSGSDFLHGFSVIPTVNMAETYHRPLKCNHNIFVVNDQAVIAAVNSVLIRATEPLKLHNFTRLEFVHLNGSVLDVIPLQPVSGQPGLYTGGPFIPPNDFFYLSVCGYGKDSYPMKRITPTAISAQTPELPTVDIASTYKGRSGHPLTLICRVESLVPFTVRWYKDGAVKTRLLKYNQTAEVPLQIPAVEMKDAGKYLCKVQIPNIYGSVVKNTVVHVTGPPPQVMTQNEVATRAGVLAHLMCNVTSDMGYNVSWYRLVSRTPTERRQPSLELVKESPQIRIYSNNSLILLSPQLSDEGWYICTAQNEGGKTSGRVYLLMQELPTVQVMASQREFTSGSSVDIHCHVLAGIPYPSITWKKGNNIIQVLEERNYDSQWIVTLRDLQRKDEGVYSCEAKNAVGTETGSVTLRFVELPQVQAESDSLSVRQGNTALLNCLVSGIPSPRLSWLKDSTDLTQKLPRIQILENGTLEIQDTNEENSGQYTCVARNKVGVARAYIDLEVGSPPHIVHPPADLEVPIGKSGSMLCAATGTPVPHTTWTQHGQPLHNPRIFVSDPGELFIKDARIEDEGNYTCSVENMFGKATYQIAVRVTGVVVPKLMAESLPSSTKALLGHTIQLPCPVLEGNPSPSRHWYKDGVLLEEASNSDGSLLLSNVTTDDAGQYQCVVSNVGGQDSISTTLNILVPPRILSEEGDMKAVEGSSLSLPCVTTGQPLPSVSWIWHGRRFLSEQEGSSLDLHNVTFLNSGTYTCLAISPAGTDSISVQLDILVPPKISQWKENVTASEGQYTQLECHITANPPANISWYHEQRLLPYHSNIVRFAVNKSMEGQYKCVAENEVGSSTQLINLFVPVVPRIDPLTSTKVVGVAGDMVTLLCPVTGDPKPTVTWSKLDSLLTSKVNEDGSVMLNNLTPADTGTYLCSATNIAGSAVLPVSLDVMVKPVITDWQTEVSVLEGELLTLSCESEGKPPPSITWLKEGRLLTSHGPIYQTTAKRENAGNYTCNAENNYGVDQQQLTVVVIVPAQIMNNEEENVHLFSNTSETKLVCLIEGIPQPVVSWLKDSVYVKEKDDHRLRPENNSLTITNASQDLAGMYICHVENIAGIAQKMFEVEFYEPPKILEHSPTNITLRERDDYTIPCSAAGTPTPAVKWRRHEMVLLPGFQTDEMVIMQDNMLVLTQVTSASEGQYVCEADSPAGHAHRNYSVHVIVPPVVVDKSVTRLDIVESNEGLLICPVQQGSPQSSVVWLKDGVPINLEENERADDTHYNLRDGGLSLKIAEARSDDTGMYTCVATNLAGRSQASFAVEVLVHPHFLDEFPETEFVVSEGERVVLDCSVGGNPEPKVSWKRVELGLPVTQHTMPGMMLELPSRWRVIIPAVRPHHTGTYQCSAVNKLGKETKQFSLRVTAPPELDGPKEEKLEISLNEKAVLQCRVWGTPAPAIVWEYSNSTSGFQMIQNPGFDLRLFELSPLAPSEAGTYKCTAVNAFGTVSKLFNVTISEPPKIEQSELTEELKVSIGSDMSLSCVTSGTPPPVVSWLHNGHLVSSQSLVDGHTHSLLLGPVNTTSGGKYLCVASNKAGVAEKAFKVKILVPPRISESYQFSADPHVVVVEGLPLTIRCPVTGTPPPNITWHKDGRHLNNTNDLISIKEVRRNDSGNYTCTATNHVGKVSKSFLVDVHTAPVLKEDAPQQLTVLSKTELSLDCSVIGHPVPSILWLNGTHPLSNSAVISITNNNQTMTIGSINLDHSGHYSCIASNIAGAVEKSFDVDVLEPPSFMGDEAAGNRPSTMQKVMLHRKVMLECPVSGTPPPNITWYKDGEVVVKPQLSEGGQVLHVMNALPRHAGNYSCMAENAAGTTRLFLPLTVIVPLQWSEWTEWTSCSKSCGGGKEVRERECGHNTITASDFVELDSSECVGEKEQIRLCNVLPCQVHGGWGEWTNWTSCSESCGPGTRRRYRQCDSPSPAFGGDPCYGSDGQQEQCIIQPCPLQSQWSEWTSWSRCTTKCGMGTKFRARQCVRGDQLAKDCEGQKLEVTSCFSRMCPVDGKWSAWGPWTQCTSSCLRQRQRLCSKPLYGGKPCIGDNIQIEKCYTADCQKSPIMNTAPKSASLHITGELNGERVEGMYLDADIRQDGSKRLVTATLKDILKAQANWFPYLTFLMPPLPWNSASEKEKANNGYSLTNGNFTEESRFQFATGQELVVKHKGKGVDKTGDLKVEIEVVGKVPMIQPTASVVISPYTEDYIRTGPNSLYTSSGSSLDVDGKKQPFTWNRTVVYDRSQGTMPYLVEKLSTDEIASQYNPEYQQLNFKVSSEISRKFHHDICPQGFRLDPVHHHCSDIDECKEWKKACHKSQICENQFGSYHCQCQPGFRLSPDGVKCIDVNECEESEPCSHNCHNTKGSFYCSCPPHLALGHGGRSCKAWGELDLSESREDYDESDPKKLFLEANAMESVACRPGLVWDNNKCSDVNECTNENPCVEEEVCINTQGSYHCMPTPCVNSYWDQISRSCIKMCDEWPEGCSGNTTIAEIVKHEAVKLNSSSLRPYEELVKLQPLGLHLEPLTRTVYDITSNKLDVPLRIRIENGEGILYALKYFQINGITRVMIKASSFSRNYKTELYTTYYVILMYID